MGDWPTVAATPTRVLLSKNDLHALLQARHASPHAVLGMHPTTKGRTAGVIVRALLRQAGQCAVVDVTSGEVWPMTSLAPAGLFEVLIPKRPRVFRYQLRSTQPGGAVRQFFDPYSFRPTLGEQDLYRVHEDHHQPTPENTAPPHRVAARAAAPALRPPDGRGRSGDPARPSITHAISLRTYVRRSPRQRHGQFREGSGHAGEGRVPLTCAKAWEAWRGAPVPPDAT